MKDKVCIITGKTRLLSITYAFIADSMLGTNSALGIGRASAHQFAQNGAKAIYLCDFSDSLLETHKRELNSLYPSTDIHTRRFDAGDEASVKKVVEEAFDKYSRLDVFFANAGMAAGKMFTEITPEEFMKMMKTNTLRYIVASWLL
jgi:NAD(P)-dependent dehydrogenase (short-subunit alcohol dehydrogenase family)